MMDSAAAMTDQVIEHFYEGVLSPQAWSEGLALLCKMAGSEQSALTTWDRRTNRATVYESFGLPDECCRDFIDHYCHLDPARNWIDRIGVGDWYIDHRHVGAHAMQRSAFYEDFLRRYGLGSVVVAPLLREPGINSFLVIQHGLTRPYARQGDPIALNHVVSHLRRAVRLRWEFEGVALRADLASTVLGQLRSPLLVADDSGRIMLANPAAELLLRRSLCLSVHGEQVCLNGAHATSFQRLLDGACGVAGPKVAGGYQMFNLNRELALQIVVAPLPVRYQAQATPSRPLALVLIHDAEHPPGVRENLLRQIYGLSPSEARVTLAMLKGASPHEVALRSGVSLATVRSQLRSVFRKTGTARQSELIRMMAVVLMLED
jgi:DNA-binding CsgD family transcriptional regulator/PAS domain-containing protein